ncbi:MAG: bifunctional phosphopantothenoylcysteine decarboxylase/phosphopantothenate--cysteine ligase CoaBC [Porticoccaceae bacterium]|nr:bifunctional phosphopantothenoylcysteine decarboxylase/phosphopantothenate--cysteine ligase CoaBC [Porticoccaceae bacterium]
MGFLANKRILLGVTGGIAAYKSADLVRRLQDAGAEVRVAMTPAAREFIAPLTFQALSGNPVHCDLLDPAAEAAMGHIELARWADAVIVAPATADFLAKLASGAADNLLLATCLATAAPIALAPAMNQGMWSKASTAANVELLRSRGFTLLGPDAGSQACGDIGPGRMLEPLAIIAGLDTLFSSDLLAGKKVVITAGPTREAIDPVRYISNHSSGKMGYALAAAAAAAGADTWLISGPTALATPERVKRIAVTSATEMLEATLSAMAGCHLFIGSAAVADYRPLSVAEHKIKKKDQSGTTLTLVLEKNPDIIATVAALPNRPLTVGFAAETCDLEVHARQKLDSKNLDAVIANDVSRTDIGFNSDDNQVLLVTAGGADWLPLMNKSKLAQELIARLAARL